MIYDIKVWFFHDIFSARRLGFTLLIWCLMKTAIIAVNQMTTDDWQRSYAQTLTTGFSVNPASVTIVTAT